MNLAQPAGRVSPAFADMDNEANGSQAEKNDKEYIVQPADNMNELDNHDVSIDAVDSAMTGSYDTRKFSKNVTESNNVGNSNMGISVEMLKQGPTEIDFEGAAGICRGMEMHAVRRVTLVLSKFLPAIYDQRGKLMLLCMQFACTIYIHPSQSINFSIMLCSTRFCELWRDSTIHCHKG
jgi:hypothetical protein